MPHVRTMVEQGLRKAGLFESTKLALRKMQTRSWAARSLLRRAMGGGAMPATRRGTVVMFHNSRSGSTVLAGQLSAHPDLTWDGEIFNYHWRRWRQQSGSQRDQVYREIRRRSGFPATPYFGFEVNPIQVHYAGVPFEQFIPAMQAQGVTHFISLRRENVLRLVVSERVAALRGMYHLKPGEKAKQVRIALDPHEMQSHLGIVTLDEKIRQFQDRYDAVDRLAGDTPLLNLSYEADVMNDPTVGYRRICSFLEIEPVDRDIALRPTTNQPLSELLEDYDAVREMLEPTEFAWMLSALTAPVAKP